MKTVWMDAGRPAVYPWHLKYPGLPVMAALIWASMHFISLWWLFATVPAAYLASSAVSGFWWLENDEDADKGFVFRYIRNNSMNFKRFVIGVADRGHWVTGSGNDPTIVIRSDIGERGWKWSVIWIGPVPLLPFVS